MQKIINGKRYDTATASVIATDKQSNGDPSDWSEILYRKRTGEYFLYGRGGPKTKYAHSVGDNSWSGGEQIIPLSLKSAKEWAKEHLDGDHYRRIFGAVEESDSVRKTTVSVRLTHAAITKLSNLAAAGQTSKSEIVEQLIMDK